MNGNRPEKPRLTLEDVAARAGVSPITVSRTVRHPDLVAPKTRIRVERAIAALGYVPDLVAGSLASRQTRQIAIVVPSLNTPAFMGTIRGISEYLSAREYQFVLGDTNLSGEDEEKLIASLLGRRADAIILADRVQSPGARAMLKHSRIPVVETWTLTRRPIDMNVGFDNCAAAETAVKHLIDLGRRRIGMICGPLRANDRGRQRRLGFHRAMVGAGLSPDLFLELSLPIMFADAARALAALREWAPTLDAVFCSGDTFAVGALFQAQRQGWHVPDDIAIVGLGDLDLADHVVPAITSVRVPGYEMGRLAAEMTVRRLSGESVVPRIVDVGFTLTIRGSTSAAHVP